MVIPNPRSCSRMQRRHHRHSTLVGSLIELCVSIVKVTEKVQSLWLAMNWGTVNFEIKEVSQDKFTITSCVAFEFPICSQTLMVDHRLYLLLLHMTPAFPSLGSSGCLWRSQRRTLQIWHMSPRILTGLTHLYLCLSGPWHAQRNLSLSSGMSTKW